MFIYLLIFILIILIVLLRGYFFSLVTFISLRLEGKEPDFRVLNSLRDDLIHERKKKIASLEMILSTWVKGEEISTHLDYFKNLLSQLKAILKDQRRNLLLLSSSPFLWVKLNRKIANLERNINRMDREEILRVKTRLNDFSEEIEKTLGKATQKFTFSLNQVVKEAVKIVKTEKDRVLIEKGIEINEKYEDIGERFRLPYKSYKDWQKLVSNLIRNGVEAVEQKLQATSDRLPAGKVRIEVRGARVDITVGVEDNGIGMDEKTKDTFYKRGFTQGKESGLGLGITEEAVGFINKYGSWRVESEPNKGTKIEIRINKVKAKAQDLKIETGSALVIKLKSRKAVFGLTGIAILLIGSGIYFQFNKYARFWQDWNPAYVEIDKGDPTNALIKNRGGETIWTKKYESKIWRQALGVGDIDGDEKNEVVIGILNSAEKSGYVSCLNYKEKEMWRFTVGRKGVYPDRGDLYSPTEIILADLNRDKTKEVIVTSFCVGWYPMQIVLLSRDGKIKGEYWHSGNIAYKFIKDIDKDGELEMVFSGINNKLDRSPTVVVLDWRKIKGQSPPYLAKNILKAEEKFYVAVASIKEIVEKIKPYPQADFQYLGQKEGYDEYSLTVSDFSDNRGYACDRQFIVDQNFQIKMFLLQENYYNEWQRFLDKGIVNYQLTDSVKQKLQKFQIWENGIKVQ